ncbi:MAG: ribonuclease HII [Armatimonadetes bacterium]|nr:ribonuclease HII [Armatimonadota bacterium]
MAGLIHLPGVAGCDEAGRGPLAGPVVCAAVVLPKGFDVRGLDDSKKLTRDQRVVQELLIKDGADWAIDIIEPWEIDQINILEASLLGMTRALERLSAMPEMALVDGNQLPRFSPCRCEAQVKGDAAYACIAAASILAKTARDRIMMDLSDRYPGYGFEHNFGYSTPEHLEALMALGPCPIHRRTFAPVSALINQPVLDFSGYASIEVSEPAPDAVTLS